MRAAVEGRIAEIQVQVHRDELTVETRKGGEPRGTGVYSKWTYRAEGSSAPWIRMEGTAEGEEEGKLFMMGKSWGEQREIGYDYIGEGRPQSEFKGESWQASKKG